MRVLLLLPLLAYVSAVPKCPDPPSETPTLLPNPEDCTTYYQCVGTTPILEHCPPGLEWNQAVSICDWPESAQCTETSAEPTEPTTSGTEGPSDATSSNPEETTIPYPTECPPEDGPVDVLLKNPKDCHSFFKCLKGKPYLIQCPPGQEWADQLKRCDWPELAHCKVESYLL